MGLDFPSNDATSLTHVSDLPTYSPADQFGLLASISNYHRFAHPSINNPNTIVQPMHITYCQHSFYDPDAKENTEGYFISEHIPTTPRNRLIYFVSNEKTQELHKFVKFLIGRDGSVTSHEDIEEIPNYDPQPKKKRK